MFLTSCSGQWCGWWVVGVLEPTLHALLSVLYAAMQPLFGTCLRLVWQRSGLGWLAESSIHASAGNATHAAKDSLKNPDPNPPAPHTSPPIPRYP